MALSPGTKICHYDVTALLGEGGMGQVWQATDTQLNRQVALKILPDAFAADPDRLARFQREALILASLNHPNIAAIHGLEEGEVEGRRALVLELVEGPTLADRISKGPIPLDEALPIAKQIAEALEAAHEAGVIHRDLKPANIKVREDGTVKVLDFGLAKAFQPDAGSDPSESPTVTAAAATRAGVILGTAAYMSPEQASGKPVDKRADIWSFGVVLFEMLTGKRAFDGETVSHVLAAVLQTEPDWTALPPETPPAIQALLRRCLAKKRRQRAPDIGIARIEIDDALSAPAGKGPAAAVTHRANVWPRLAAAVLLLVAGATLAGLAVWTMLRPEPPDVIRFTIAPPDIAPLGLEGTRSNLEMSSDGSRIVYVGIAPDENVPRLMLRSLDQLVGVPIPGTEGGHAPFLSPDGEWVGFIPLSNLRLLQRIPTSGGSPMTVTESPSAIYGASWGEDDQIVFSALSGVYTAASSGHCNNSASFSDGFIQPSVCRGRSLSRCATRLRWRWL